MKTAGAVIRRARAAAATLLAAALLGRTPASAQDADHFRSGYLEVGFSRDRGSLEFLGVDSLGGGRVGTNVLGANPAAVAGDSSSWRFRPSERSLGAESLPGPDGAGRPLQVTVDTHVCYGTLLGVLDAPGSVALPAVLHLPGFGTLRITSDTPRSLGYTSGAGWIRLSFPAGGPGQGARYTLDVVEIHPAVRQAEGDRRYDGFRRNWLNVLQLNPNRGVLSNNTNSDTCGFCYYEYADIARETPPLAPNLRALDLVKQTLGRVFGGMKTYGMPGYGDFPEESSDTFPSLLIAADDVAEGLPDPEWLGAHYPSLRAMAEKMLSTDRNGDGLVKYAASGNSGSWNEGLPKVRPSNWWDTIGFGYEDAYANALAYRALRAMGRMAGQAHQAGDSARYSRAAERLHDAYMKAFFDPATGILGGWRSADGALHDDAFVFVNGIAVLYGLVPPKDAPAIMDRIWRRISEAGYSNFRMGLPGNLVPVPRRDYAHKDPRYGGGMREDNLDGFQIYENGGATACFSYFTIAALDRVGAHDRADRVLFPILDAFEKREFEGTGSNGRTNDWRKWDGTAEGYEGFLTDNYYTLLAVVGRQDPASP